MLFARDTRSKTSFWMGILMLDPSKLDIKRKLKVSILKPSWTILGSDNRDQNQRKNGQSFEAPGSEMLFARDARSKTSLRMGILMLDPSRVDIKRKLKISILKPSLTILGSDNRDQNQRKNGQSF